MNSEGKEAEIIEGNSRKTILELLIAIPIWVFVAFCSVCAFAFNIALATSPIWGGFMILAWLFG